VQSAVALALPYPRTCCSCCCCCCLQRWKLWMKWRWRSNLFPLECGIGIATCYRNWFSTPQLPPPSEPQSQSQSQLPLSSQLQSTLSFIIALLARQGGVSWPLALCNTNLHSYMHTYIHWLTYVQTYVCIFINICICALSLFADDVNYSVCCGCICIYRFLDRSNAHRSPITNYSLSTTWSSALSPSSFLLRLVREWERLLH